MFGPCSVSFPEYDLSKVSRVTEPRLFLRRICCGRPESRSSADYQDALAGGNDQLWKPRVQNADVALRAELTVARLRRAEVATSQLVDHLKDQVAACGEEVRILRTQLAERQAAFEKLALQLLDYTRERDRYAQELTARLHQHVLSASGEETPDVRRSPPRNAPDKHLATSPARPWLPHELQHFWIAQQLRDYIVERFGEEEVGKVEYLMAMVSHFDGAKVPVDASPIGQDLIARIRRRIADQPVVEKPEVSIIIPVYNNLIYTLTSMLSILQNGSRYSYEILIGDDRSTDATETVIERLGPVVRNIRQASNKGFLGNCNATAAVARGRVLVFLNNDTVTLPNWLDNLVEILEQPNVGMSGSKLLNGNGSLQEAGGIFWKDGSAWNFGRDQDPRAPEFNYVKDVDYCSGASIALRRDLWREVEGFDRLFTPAYCEDADLAFRVRAAGLRCVYHPHSEVIHHEGRSHGTDTAVGIKAYQVINQQKLRVRWSHVLQREHFADGEELFVARDRSHAKPHILIIDHYVPQWDRDAGSRSMFHIMRFLQGRGFQITFWPDNLNYDAPYVRKLQAMGVEVIYSAAYKDGLERWVSANRAWVKYILCSRPHITQRYLEQIRRATDRPVFYYGHDLHWRRLARQYDVSRDAKLLEDIEAMRKLEENIFARVDGIIYPSKEERDEVAAIAGARTPVIEMPAWCFGDAELAAAEARLSASQQRDRTHLLFVGGFSHAPNVDALMWFVGAILPKVLRQDTRFRLSIVGSNMPDAIRNLASPGIAVLGALSDEELSGLYAVCGMVVVPLRYGAGVKGKVIEAFARGAPVVTTPTGVQGVPNADAMAFVGETEDAFASAILAAAWDRELAVRKARAALQFVRHRYSDRSIARALAPIIPELDAPSPRPRV